MVLFENLNKNDVIAVLILVSEQNLRMLFCVCVCVCVCVCERERERLTAGQVFCGMTSRRISRICFECANVSKKQHQQTT